MTPPRKDKEGVDIHLSWANVKTLFPWIMMLLMGGGAAGMGSGMFTWGSPRSSANSQAIVLLQAQAETCAKHQQETAESMIGLQKDMGYVKKMVNKIDNRMHADRRRHASRPPPRPDDDEDD